MSATSNFKPSAPKTPPFATGAPVVAVTSGSSTDPLSVTDYGPLEAEDGRVAATPDNAEVQAIFDQHRMARAANFPLSK